MRSKPTFRKKKGPKRASQRREMQKRTKRKKNSRLSKKWSIDILSTLSPSIPTLMRNLSCIGAWQRKTQRIGRVPKTPRCPRTQSDGLMEWLVRPLSKEIDSIQNIAPCNMSSNGLMRQRHRYRRWTLSSSNRNIIGGTTIVVKTTRSPVLLKQRSHLKSSLLVRKTLT